MKPSSTPSRRTVLALAGAAGAVAAVPTRALAVAAKGAKKFPKGFVWGTATSAYQVEGAAAEDGRGPSVWDTFCKKPGAVFEGHTGDVACDHYHRYRDDVGLLKTLGVQAYRFSLSWSRLLPEGRGQVNQAGVDFYNRLLDELLKIGVQPYCTLFHWDFPQALHDKGGWKNRDVANWFADYASLAADKFGDRIADWVTQNEPQVYIGGGHLLGSFAPGLKLPFSEYLTCAHNSMRAHAKAVLALRAAKPHPKGTRVGYVLANQVGHPHDPGKPEDIEAARAGMFANDERTCWTNAWWMDPVLLGRYPEDGVKAYGKDMPRFPASDLDEMKQPLDYLGANIYTSTAFTRDAAGKLLKLPTPPGHPRSGVDWQPIRPQALYWGPKFIAERYKLPIFITENGLSTRDQVALDGKVHDAQRVDYIHRVLLELQRAIADGADVRGYFHWSLLDNFEWAEGYKQRFGLVYVDFQSLKRVPKDSFHFYKKVVASNGGSLAGRFAVPVTELQAP